MAFFVSCAECDVDAIGELTAQEVIRWVNDHVCEDDSEESE